MQQAELKNSEELNGLNPGRLFLTIKEAAFALNVSEKSVRRLIERGLLKPSLALRKKLIPRKQIENFFEKTR